MKLAISLGHGLSPSEAVAAAGKLERFGFDFAWVSESVGFDSLPILGAMAGQTRKIGLGTGVANVYSRSATQLAMAAATVQELSNGRFVLGIGASSLDVVEKWHGLDFGGQLDRVREYLDALRPRLKARRGALPAPFSSVKDSVPIFMAGVGDRMVELARRKADGVLFFLRPLSDLRARCRVLSSGSFLVCANVVTCVSDDTESAEARARKTIAFYLTYGDSYRKLVDRLAPSEKARAAVAAARRLWLRGRVEDAAKRVPGELLEELAIYGTPSECRREIEEYAGVEGLHMLGLQFNPPSRGISSSIALYASLPRAL